MSDAQTAIGKWGSGTAKTVPCASVAPQTEVDQAAQRPSSLYVSGSEVLPGKSDCRYDDSGLALVVEVTVWTGLQSAETESAFQGWRRGTSPVPGLGDWACSLGSSQLIAREKGLVVSIHQDDTAPLSSAVTLARSVLSATESA